MHSCYLPPSEISSDTIRIGEPGRHHLLNVLRLEIGEDVQILDGEGNIYIARLIDTNSSFAIASIRDHQFHPPISPHITLFQAIPKSDKMNLIVQKVTEIGVDEIVPMICQRSIPKRTAEAQKRQQNRWARIAIEASKQSQRPRFPKLLDTRNMKECLNRAQNLDLSLFLWENETECGLKKILRIHRQVGSIGLFVGPEGGFSEEEAGDAVQIGGISTSFGRYTLRTETAAIVAVALVAYELRDVS